MRRFLIDTDTASDDAVALLMALRWPGGDVQVDAITVVNGNVPLAQGARNAAYTVELCGAETPVHLGCDRPLLRAAEYATWFHGSDGMGDMKYPAAKRPYAEEHAVDALVRLVRARPGEYTLVTLGPLTNIAVALCRAPDIATRVAQVCVMGGAACCVGNVTPAAEYNIYVDPDAARIVFHSGLPILMVGWEHCRFENAFNSGGMEEIRRIGTKFSAFMLDCNRTAIEAARQLFGDPGLTLPDPVTMAVALDPSICRKRSKHFVDVETSSELTRGATVVDQLGITKKPSNIEVCWAIDTRRWKETLFRCLR
jgi:purine nucleosidase